MRLRTRFFDIICAGVPSSVCDAVARLVSRVETLADIIDAAEELEARAAHGSRLTLYIVSQEIPPEQLDRLARGLGEIVRKMKQSGYTGVSLATGASVVLYTDEMETVEAAVEEALHAIFSTMAGRAFIYTRFRPRDQLEEWLAEEALVHHLLYELGVATREDLEEVRRLYREVYRSEAGREPPRRIEELAERIAKELAEAIRRGSAATRA